MPEQEILSSQWKSKAEIDYIPLFISLWISFNAWMEEIYEDLEEDDPDQADQDRDRDRDRYKLNLLKRNRHQLFDKFNELIRIDNIEGMRFRGNFGELHQSLVNARIHYRDWVNETISLSSCPITWKGESSILESVLKREGQRDKIEIGQDLWIEDNTERVFAAYIEILYQIRCELFHARLEPSPANERVMKQLYLTLSMIMEYV